MKNNNLCKYESLIILRIIAIMKNHVNNIPQISIQVMITIKSKL